MNNPYVKKRGDSPPPKNSFQRELEQKMKERAKKGLSADVSISESDDDGIEEDNELLGNFNATLRPKASGYLNHGDPLMMTMKKPWQPSTSRHISSPSFGNKGQKLGSMGEEDEELLSDSDSELKKPRTSFLRSQKVNEPVQQRPKSPGIHGRKGPLSDDLDEVDYILNHSPKDTSHNPQKRSLTPLADGRLPEERKTTSRRSTPRISKSPSISRNSSDNNISQRSSPERHSPREGQKANFNGRKTPSEDHRSPRPYREGQKTSKKSFSSVAEKHDRPIEGYKSPKLVGENSKILGEGHKSPKAVGEIRRTPTEGLKSPKDTHKKLINDRESPNSDKLKKRGSVLDFLEESSSVRKSNDNSADDDEELQKIEVKNKKSPAPGMVSIKVATMSPKEDQHKPADGVPDSYLSDGESSVCKETVQEPSHAILTKEAVLPKDKAKIKMVKIQRTDIKKATEAIQIVGDCQNGTREMQYIDPVKNHAFKSDTARKSGSASNNILKPKPIYSSLGMLSTRTSGSSNEALNFDSTKDIRQAVYDVWKVQASERMSKIAKERKQKEMELQEKKKKEKEDKALESKTTFDAWMEKKKGFVSTKTIQFKKEEEKKKQEEEKRKEKQKEAEELFKKWKETKDVVLKEKYQRKINAEKREKRSKVEEKMVKQKEAESAFKKWSENKEEYLKAQKKEEIRKAKREKEEEEHERLEQQKTAYDLYEKWLEKKEKQEIETQQKMQQESDAEDGRRPWRPSSMKIHHIR